MTTVSPRTRARLTVGVLAGAVLAVALPLAASAHIHVTPEDASADASTTLTFSFSHGCEESPTTALVIDIPEGVTNVTPVIDAGWSIARDVAANGTVSRITYMAAQPVESGLKGEVSFDARFDAALADTDVAFPVTQQCVQGSTAWTEVAAEGAAEPESPAPVVAVGAVAAEGEDHHDAATADHEESEMTDAAPTAAATDPTAVWLGGAGLVLGVIALGVAVTALVRRRA
ncbi:DUF1775 domain-containing protein [Microbacterium sp. P04]|uniref:DUF1775 domain-containing protein n=1 Tax=Microbacterium sp. P04 TaxID=3366947 RepID=UPI003744F92A